MQNLLSGAVVLKDMPLSREEFRREVFARDTGLCVICKAQAVDAHHIVERRLWDDGSFGYYVRSYPFESAQPMIHQ